DREGWGHLCRMLTQANLRDETEKGATLLKRGDLLEWGDRLSLAVLADSDSPETETLAFLHGLKHRFGKDVRLAVAPYYNGRDHFRLEQAAALAAAAKMPLMAVNDVLYHARERRPLQ